MRALLDVQAVETSAPSRAAEAVSAALVAGFPRRRQLTLALVALGPHPGLTPTPWVLAGVLRALREAERTPVKLLTIGDHAAAEQLLRRAGRGSGEPVQELVERPSPDRQLSLRVGQHPRPLKLPREVVGTSLLLCAPLCLQATGERGAVSGPFATTATRWAEAQGFEAPQGRRRTSLRVRETPAGPQASAAGLGLELLQAGFARAGLILDGTWAAALAAPERGASDARPRGPDGRFVKRRAAPSRAGTGAQRGPTVLGELAATERILGLGALGELELDALLGADRWLAEVLGLARAGSGSRGGVRQLAPEFVRSPGRWPQLEVALPGAGSASQPKRLADRAISGIRSQSQRLRGSGRGSGRAALPARVPGSFAQLWTERWYAEHELGPSGPRYGLGGSSGARGRAPGARTGLR